MNIPKSYEALAADLASEKIISKTLLGQKESYMMLADKGRLDLSESKAREAALREELARTKSQSLKRLAGLAKCGINREDLQQRLTVAEQRAGKMEELLREAYEAGDHNIFGTDLDSRIDAALKPAADAKSSPPCPNCKVCMGSPDFPENCLINGVKP